MLESELVIGEPFSLHSYALSNNEERFMLQCRRGHSLPNSCLAWKRVLREQLVFLLRRQNSSCWCSKREAVAAGESRERTEWMESNLLGYGTQKCMAAIIDSKCAIFLSTHFSLECHGVAMRTESGSEHRISGILYPTEASVFILDREWNIQDCQHWQKK